MAHTCHQCGKPIPGVLIELGRAFTLPRDRLQAEDAREMVTSRFRDGLIAEDWFLTDLAERLLLARKR